MLWFFTIIAVFMFSPLIMGQKDYQECIGKELKTAYAWYNDEVITVCYELLADVLKNASTQDLPVGISRADTVIGPVLDTFLHETGHAVFNMLQIPVLGREEDAADQFAAYIMLRLGKDEARRMILGAAYQYGKNTHPGAPQALADLVPDPVFRNVDAPPPVTVDDAEPVRSDDHDDRGAGVEPALHGCDKIGAGIDAGEILKDLVVSEVLTQFVGQPARRQLAILAAVADKDARGVR